MTIENERNLPINPSFRAESQSERKSKTTLENHLQEEESKSFLKYMHPIEGDLTTSKYCWSVSMSSQKTQSKPKALKQQQETVVEGFNQDIEEINHSLEKLPI